MQNPYTNRGMICGPSIFFRRAEDLARIYDLLANTERVYHRRSKDREVIAALLFGSVHKLRAAEADAAICQALALA
jgi:hypothetical protein